MPNFYKKKEEINNMKTIAEYEVRIPDYALCYIVNDDSSGLSEEDKKNIDNFFQKYKDIAEQNNGTVNFGYDSDQESYFTWHPAFGLTCNVYDAIIQILVS